MAKFHKHFKVAQHFRAPWITRAIYRGFPKFPGYWHALRLVGKVMPTSWTCFSADIDLEVFKTEISVDVRDPYQIDVFVKDKQELCVPALIVALVPPGGMYVDVGANAGWYVRMISNHLGPSGLIVALEPDPTAFQFLSRLVLDNALFFNVAAAEHAKGILKNVSSALRQSARSTYVPAMRNVSYRATGGFAAALTLDGLLSNFHRQPGLIKIDVEGAELPVLRGAQQALRGADYVIVEVNPPERCEMFGYRLEDLYALLEGLGFSRHYEVRNADNRVRELDDGERVTGDILFSRLDIGSVKSIGNHQDPG